MEVCFFSYSQCIRNVQDKYEQCFVSCLRQLNLMQCMCSGWVYLCSRLWNVNLNQITEYLDSLSAVAYSPPSATFSFDSFDVGEFRIAYICSRGIVRGCGRPRGYGGSHAWGPGHGESRYCTVDEYQEVSGKLVLLYLSQSERSDSSK